MSFVQMFPVYVNFALRVNSQHSYLLGYIKKRNYLCQH